MASQKNNDNKKKFLKGKGSKPQFKKRGSNKASLSSVREVGENTVIKPMLTSKSKFCDIVGYK